MSQQQLQKHNPHKHPNITQLQKIFGLSTSKINLYKRKHTIQQIKEAKEYITKWESIGASSLSNQQWFADWLVYFKYKELDKLTKRLNFLKKQAKQIKDEEQQATISNSGESNERDAPMGCERSPLKHTNVFTEYDKEAIKQIPVEDILSNAGYQIIQTSPNRAKTHCPFHNDSNPSLTINIDNNYVHCFACNTSADSIKLYQVIHNVDFVNALKEMSLYI